MKNLKSNKGVTLLDLTVYLISISLIIGVMATIRSSFFKNVDIVKKIAKNAEEFDNFNAYFVKDIKESNDLTLDSNTGQYILSNGSIYVYKKRSGNIGDIYRNSVKIASDVTLFNLTKNVTVKNNVRKNLIGIDIAIGNAQNDVFKKKMQYTLKYW